ncbi:kanadaptin-like [Littorina saxatilis]|uniref:FHA domain-containing protein n=1 Tax=Littorina saxatilis TaxID=31220 RepID=A0AAN9BFX6_9CAEN
MAAASGPVETSSGKTVNMDELEPPEPPTQQSTDENRGRENTTDGFKVPELSTDKPKPVSAPKSDTDSQSQSQNSSAPQPIEKKTPVLSPAEQLKQTQGSIPYKEPIWGGIPPESEEFSLEVLKNGTLIENVELGKKPWIVFGRLPSCDVCMEHPSLSRHHAVVQYRDTSEGGHERGWYLFDLDSTHGTWVNKVKVKPNVYRRLHVGHVIKFGGSSRLYVLQGPEEDQEPESEMSVTELKQKTNKLKREAEVLKQAEQAELDEEEERGRQRQKILDARGCGWGIGEDAAEEEPDEENFVSLVPQHEHLYVDDPKKGLKGFYEREGCDLPDYQFTDVGYGKHKCIVELPVDGPNGEVLVAEATVSGKKKDAVIACALEACRLLDMHGMLHASKHESRKKKSKNWEDDDFYDSDEDTFLDRTGTIEKKRLYRMKKSGKDVKVETYESLVPKHDEVQKRIAEIDHLLEQAKAQTEAAANEEEDALDAYMSAIKAGVMDTKTRLSLKRELLSLRTEEQRLRKLVNLAKPADMPELKKLESGAKKATAAAAAVLAGVRKIGVAKGPKKPLPLPVAEPMQMCEGEFTEEVEEDEEDDTKAASLASTSAKPTTQQHTKDTLKDSSSSTEKPLPGKPSESKVSRTEKSERSPEKSGGESPATIPPQAAERPHVVKQKEKKKDIQVRGPALASDVEMQVSAGPKDPAELKPEAPPAAKRKRKMQAPKKVEYDASNPDYAMWMPPQNQSGDGRTSLNEKLGY